MDLDVTRSLCLVLAVAGFSVPLPAGTLYTFGGDFISLGASGTPDSLNSMDPASSSSVANVLTPVGSGNTGFNGGMVAFQNLLYAIGNDSNGVATLYSMGTDGTGLTAVSAAFNNTGPAAGVVFQNGLAETAGNFYAIGAGATTEDLYQVGTGTATDVAALNTYGGNYAGLAWDPAANAFYAVVVNSTTSEDLLVEISLTGSVTLVTSLTSLDGQTGTHLGGLADAGGGILYDIYTNSTSFTGMLEQIDLNGPPAATTLYDTGIPLAQNAGVGLVAAASGVPEPAPVAEIGGGLLLLSWILRRAIRA